VPAQCRQFANQEYAKLVPVIDSSLFLGNIFVIRGDYYFFRQSFQRSGLIGTSTETGDRQAQVEGRIRLVDEGTAGETWGS